MDDIGIARRARLERSRLYLCTGVRPDLETFVNTVCEAGIDIVQLREKERPAREVLEAARVARDAAHAFGALFILNDRPDLALACDADGVHVGQDDAPPSLCRTILGDDVIVGLSTHAPSELDASIHEPIDYISVGPVEATPTKPGRPGTGIEYVHYAAGHADRPFFVTGGVSPETLPDLAGSGASRFVVVRALTEASDPGAVAREMRRLADRL